MPCPNKNSNPKICFPSPQFIWNLWSSHFGISMSFWRRIPSTLCQKRSPHHQLLDKSSLYTNLPSLLHQFVSSLQIPSFVLHEKCNAVGRRSIRSKSRMQEYLCVFLHAIL
mmetsp:Transcript_8097/g.30050  ORF Transcript_8097/g.30050 Transcript_8097/m.30050 type:complete len:111 (+) Transcript_8097:646-978(+)